MNRSDKVPLRAGSDNLPLHYQMKKIYLQLTHVQKYNLESSFEAEKINLRFHNSWVHRSIICREIARNIAKRGIGAKVYSAEKAQTKTVIRYYL